MNNIHQPGIPSPVSPRKTLTLGLFGFGVVGKGLYDVLQSTPALQSSIKKICIKDIHKPRSIDASYFTNNTAELLEDPAIDVIVELIDDAEAAFTITKEALQKGKAVVTANKKMIAQHFYELWQLQLQTGTPLLYEGACCASIPVIRNLEEYYDNELLLSLRGIVNGSTNFILTKIIQEHLSFPEALLEAQQLGFAEKNPLLDTEGHDAANKLSILLAHGFGKIIQPSQLLYSGITAIKRTDATLAAEKGYGIKLVAQAKKLDNNQLAAFVLPQFIDRNDDLHNVNNEFNALIIEGGFADKHYFKGKGAGAYPTAAAVLSDIAALRYDYKYEYKKLQVPEHTIFSSDYYLRVFVSAADTDLIETTGFECIEEAHNERSNYWVTGIIHADHLLTSSWWRAPGVSLICCPDPIIDDVHYRKITKRSLELAGV